MAAPLLELRSLRKEYPAGDGTIAVLKGIDLSIGSGEMVAIVGASGSGKSTLMNILGCLDRPTSGTYRISGRETGDLDGDELARLRREHFGFVFQRYHLLPDLTALGNVEIPAAYAGRDRQARRDRAAALLGQVGLGDRIAHRPGQLSGGQQQRVSIARALMNGGRVVLADEPTGALDSRSGQDMLRMLEALHHAGHTIILVTHDLGVAGHAQRIIELNDGEVVADRPNAGRAFMPEPAGRSPGTCLLAHPDCGLQGDAPPAGRRAAPCPSATLGGQGRSPWRRGCDQLAEASRMAWLAMASHRLRTFLTMLGIIIGIASVVSVVALGEGSRQRILSDISSIGTNTIDVFPGKGFGDEKAQSIHTLTPADGDVLARQVYVDSVTPVVSTSTTLRHRNISVSAQISGVGDQYFRVHGYELATGQAFDGGSVRRLAQEAVIDENTRKALFGQSSQAVGEIILLGRVPCKVVGVTKKKQTPFGNSDSLNVWIPYTTAMSRLLGQQHLKGITVRVSDGASTEAAEGSILTLLTQRHGRKDFYVMNTDTIRQTIEKTTATMRLLISAIALISLLVGGIGVMNIMLVSVTERTSEIGVRMAVGARQSDIMRQFLVEAVLVCLVGGFLGIALALATGVLFSHTGGSFRMVFSTVSIAAAFACSTLIGVAFGYLPARNAARLDPVEALARE